MHDPRVFVAVRKLSLEAETVMVIEVEVEVEVVLRREETRESNWPA